MIQLEFLFQFLLAIGVICVTIWYFYYLYCFNYWKKKGVPTIKPQFPAGNITKPLLGRENLFITVQNYYNELKQKGCRHGGLYFFNGPVYMPVDPEIVKSMLTTDFEYFVDRGMFVDEKNFPLSGNMFSFKGAQWRNSRIKLSPTFSSGKLKTMFNIFAKMTEDFVDTIEERIQKDKEINIKHLASNFTADIIFSTAFGLEAATLKNPNNDLSKKIQSILSPPTWLFLKTIILEGFKNPGNLIRVVLSNKSISDFFTEIVRNTIKHRDENKVDRKDFLSLLLEVRDTQGLTFDEIAAQCFLFIVAGFETSSQTISMCIHELAHNQELQDKLRREIFENLEADFKKYTYENIFNLPYLEKVFNETLRLYPVLGFFNRVCVKPYKVPGTDVVIEEGTPALIPVLGLQRDPEYFPNPLKFDPERFGDDQKLVPFTFLPFGEGPRFCIGMRYGKLQTKLGIAALISQFQFFPSPNTPKEVEFDKLSKTLAMTPGKGITVRAVKIGEGIQ